jgi:hypothetical protein
MKYYILVLASCLALASCTRPPATTPPHSEPIGLDTPPADTSTDREFVRINSANPAENGPAQAPVKLHLFPSDAGSTPQEVVRRRLFGLLPAKKAPAAAVAGVPRKCKGCTFNLVAGNQTVAGKKAQVAAGDGTTASVIEKKAGPAQVASDSSTLNAVLGGGNLAAVHGDGNTLPQTATTQQAADWRATLAKPAGYALAAVGTMLIVGGVIFLIAAYRRRNKLLNNA